MFHKSPFQLILRVSLTDKLSFIHYPAVVKSFLITQYFCKQSPCYFSWFIWASTHIKEHFISRLPDRLIRILRHEINSYALEKFDAAPVEIPFYRLERRTFRIRLAKIEVNNNEESLWLLRMERIVDAYSKLFRLLQGQGLTAREIEICILLKNGLETRKIAIRLCVSYNTIRNHQQSIFKKTSVTTQVQLIAYLNKFQE